MRAYGIRRKDSYCCPGHDKFPSDTYNNNTSQKAHTRDTKIAHSVARARIRAALHKFVRGISEDVFFDGQS